MNEKFILILILLFNINNANDIVSFKIESYLKNINYNNITSLINSIEKTYIYNYIKIGEPEYLIETKFSMATPHLNMHYTEENITEEEKNKIYNINKSKTFKNISRLHKYYVKSYNDIHAKEKFKINLYNIKDKTFKEITLNDFDFVYGVKLNDDRNKNLTQIYYLTIGFQFLSKTKYSQENTFNFIDNLKSRNIIQDYTWFIYFDNNKIKNNEINNLKDLLNINMTFIIGDYPHIYKPYEFSKDQIYYVYNDHFFWSLKFKSIYLYVNQAEYNSRIIKQTLFETGAQINFNDFFIYAPYTYLQILHNYFFKDYMKNNICAILFTENLDTIYCNKSDNFNLEHLKKFPTLYLEHNEFNFTFELTYKDLFAEIDNKYIFLVVNMNTDVQDFFLGRVFLFKYQFFFNQDSKGTGFYNPNIKFDINKNDTESINDRNEKLKEKEKENYKYKILIIVLGCLLFISIVIIFIYAFNKCKNKKRKRANELDDDFDYYSDKNIIND